VISRSEATDRVEVAPARSPLRGRIAVPGDKSIAHRALMFSALAGRGSVRGLPGGADVQATLGVLYGLGAKIHIRGVESDDGSVDEAEVLAPIRAASGPLHCGDSGTTMRLMAGVLCAAGVEGTLTADAGLAKRPMERIAEPLRRMGARVETTDGHAPVHVRPGALVGIEHASAVASAQVKSCVLLAGLRASGTTTVREPSRSRDHTERMLEAMGVAIERTATSVALRGGQKLTPVTVEVPGDLSSAAFPVAAALLVPGSEVEIEGVGLNPTRSGFLDALAKMGADVEAIVEGSSGGEPFGRIVARGDRALRAIEASGELVVRSIDELPALCAVAAFAKGRSVFKDASELRKKESDRIAAMARGLRALGVSCEELEDGIAIEGDPDRVLRASSPIDGSNDHRIVMAFACAALRAAGPVTIDGFSAIRKSYPGFFTDLARLGGRP